MNEKFKPGYKDFQRDIEGYLISIGKREKRKDGMVVFHGYDDALKSIFTLYLDRGIVEPLVKHFRSWNWEWSYNQYLLDLTASLRAASDWKNLQVLWEKGVLRARKKHYNDMWKINKDNPGSLEPNSLQEVKHLLLEALRDIEEFARECGAEEDYVKYSKMTWKVQNDRRA